MNVHIIGMARSGLAAAEILTAIGARVTLHDQKDADKLSAALEKASDLGVQVQVGASAYAGLDQAELVVTSPGVPSTSPGIMKAVELGIPIIPEIELAYRISKAPIVAITGTNGKTTTTALTGEMFKQDGRKVFIAGNIVAGEIRLPLVFAAFRAEESDIIVAEISSFQLEQISSFRPRVAALLNVTGDHLDRYPNLESYAAAKARIFEYQTPDDFAVLNADDDGVLDLADSISSRRLWFSSSTEVSNGAFTRGTEVWMRTSEGEESICDTRTMKLRGRHNVENVLAAALIALSMGASKDCVQKAVDAFEAPEHRLEPVAEIRGVEFLNNSMCTNVAAAVKSLEAIGRPAIVIAGGKDKGSDYAPLGAAFAQHAKHVVLIGKDAPLIEKAARDAGFDRIRNAASMGEAVETAWTLAESGDTVVLSPGCASFDMFDDFEHRGRVFKDAVKSLAAREGA